MSFEITGKLVAKFEIVQRNESFKTREFVIEKTDEVNGRSFSNFIKFQCVQDKTAIIDRVNTGDNVKVYFNIKGTKWEKDGKVSYITNLDAWRIEQLLNVNSSQQVNNDYLEPLDTFSASSPDTVDDLPF